MVVLGGGWLMPTIAHFEMYKSDDGAFDPGDNQDPTVANLSTTLRDEAADDDILVLMFGGDRLDNPGPPTMPDGTAYGSDDWDDGGDMLYDIQASTGSSAITWIKLTDESALPATLSIATGANRPIGVGIFLVRGVDATLIEGWTNASSSDPSWAENTVLNSGAGTTSDDSLILSITASDGGDSAYQSESVSLTPGSWTEHDQFFVDWTVNCWGTFGSIAQATAGTLAKQDVFSVQTSDACCTIALPGTAVAADVFPPFRRRVNTLARM